MKSVVWLIDINSLKKQDMKCNFLLLETNKARQQAHIITQGSGELPYMPLWLGSGWG